jgi:hypothetical protein
MGMGLWPRLPWLLSGLRAHAIASRVAKHCVSGLDIAVENALLRIALDLPTELLIALGAGADRFFEVLRESHYLIF